MAGTTNSRHSRTDDSFGPPGCSAAGFGKVSELVAPASKNRSQPSANDS